MDEIWLNSEIKNVRQPFSHENTLSFIHFVLDSAKTDGLL
jgi:hypothetical protein